MNKLISLKILLSFKNKIINYFKSHSVFIFLFSIILFYIVNNYIWLKLSAPFPTFFYYAFDFLKVIEFHNILNKFRLDLVINQLINVHNAYAYSVVVALTTFIFHKSYIAIILFNNILYFAIAVFSIYTIAKKLSDKTTALLAVAIFSLYPAVYGISRFYVVEFAVMGMVALSILCLLNSEEFTNRRYSILFGLSLGWGMVIKYSPIVFVIGPLIYVLIKALISSQRDKAVRFPFVILNIGFFALAAAGIMGIKYFNFNNIRSYLMRPFGSVFPSEPWYKFDNLRIYTLGLFEHQLSLLFFFVLLFALFGFFFKAKRKIIVIFLSWIIVPWLILVTMPCSYRSTHFIIPYLPAMALISAIGLMHILKRNKKLKVIIIGIILVIGIIQYYDFSFGFGPNLSNWKIKIKKDLFVYNYLLSESVCCRPQDDEIYNKIISSIVKRCNKYGSKVTVLPPAVLFSYAHPHVWNCIQWYKNLPFEITAFDINILFIDNVLDSLRRSDFILYAGNNNIKDDSYLDYVLKKIFELHKKVLDNDNLERINQFLEQDSKIFRESFHRLISKFALVERIPYKGDYFNIYEKN